MSVCTADELDWPIVALLLSAGAPMKPWVTLAVEKPVTLDWVMPADAVPGSPTWLLLPF